MWPWRHRNEYTRLEDYDRAWHSKKPAVTALTGPKAFQGGERRHRSISFLRFAILPRYVPAYSASRSFSVTSFVSPGPRFSLATMNS
jgi:hypothetical protein